MDVFAHMCKYSFDKNLVNFAQKAISMAKSFSLE